MGLSTNGNIPSQLLTLDGKNWDRWSIQMKALFNFQEVTEIIKNGFPELGPNPTDAQRNAFKENQKKDGKALFIIHQSVDLPNFDKVATATTSKQAWDILEKCYAGGEKVKKVRLQSLKRQYELIQMEETETIADFFIRIRNLVNQMAGCGKTTSDEDLCEKILRSLPPKFDFIVCTVPLLSDKQDHSE